MLGFVAVSYGAGCAAFIGLAFALATVWRSRAGGSGLRIAVAATAIWAGVDAVVVPAVFDARIVAADLLKTFAWLWFVSRALAGPKWSLVRAAGYVAAVALAAVVLVAALLARATGAASIDATTAAQAASAAAVLLAALGLVVTEQAARNTRDSRVWAVKFIWLASATIFTYDLVLFSNSYLAPQALPLALWAARGLVACAVMPLLAIGIARTERLERHVVMSQNLVFYAVVAVATASYLMGLALLAEFVRVRAGAWGDVLSAFLGFSGLLVLAVLFLSGSARAWVSVLLAKHLLPHKYNYRSEWRELTERLAQDGDGTSLPERIVGAFKRLTHASDGGCWVRDDRELVPRFGGWFGAAPPSEPITSAFCRYLEAHDWIVDLNQCRAGIGPDARVPVPAWLLDAADAWLAVPLLQRERLVALVVLEKPPTGGQLTWEDLDLLRTVARQAASYVALEQAAEALSRERQFAALHRFTAFLVHDLANVVAQQRLLVDNAATHGSNPRFIQDAFSTISDTTRRMARVLDQIKAGVPEASPGRVRLRSVCEAVLSRLQGRVPRPTLQIADDAADAFVAAERLERVIEHLVCNAQDATGADGTVTVRVGGDGATVSVAVVDTGKGMDASFVRDRLFRPFDTTKGASGMGLGAFEVREFVAAAGGHLEVTSAPGSGTSIVLRLPRLEAPDTDDSAESRPAHAAHRR